MEKITKREMYEAIICFGSTGKFEFDREEKTFTVSMESLMDFAEHEIELLDKKATKAKEHAAKKRAENDELTNIICGVMSTTDFESIPDIAARIEGEDVTIGKVQYRLTQLVKNGAAEKQEITIPATENSKTRKIQGYKLTLAEDIVADVE